MILKGNARGGARDLAVHLMKDENEHIDVHELRGFVSDDLMGALQESHAISKGTKCRQFLYSLSLNPPQEANVSTDDFVAAIDKVEGELGLTGQPRAVVFHEKEGRRHAHAVWSRINIEEMKAVQLSFDRQKLQSVSKELYREHGWQMPRGLANASERDPLNFSLAEWQQAKRLGKDPKAIKAAFQDAWAISDSKTAFTHALKERGYYLARGDRRGFVAVDCVSDEVYAIPRWASVKTKAVRERLGDEDALPSMDQTREQIAQGLLPKLQSFQREISAKEDFKRQEFEHRKLELVTRQRAEREAQTHALAMRTASEARDRQARFRKGLGGIWDRLRGVHSRIAKRNTLEAEQSAQRDRLEKDAVITKHLGQRRALMAERRQALGQLKEQRREIEHDVSRVSAGTALNPTPQRKPDKPRIRVRADVRVSAERAKPPPENGERQSRTKGEPPTSTQRTERSSLQPSAPERSASSAFDKAARKDAFLKRRREIPANNRAPEPARSNRGPSIDR